MLSKLGIDEAIPLDISHIQVPISRFDRDSFRVSYRQHLSISSDCRRLLAQISARRSRRENCLATCSHLLMTCLYLAGACLSTHEQRLPGPSASTQTLICAAVVVLGCACMMTQQVQLQLPASSFQLPTPNPPVSASCHLDRIVRVNNGQLNSRHLGLARSIICE